MKRLLSALLVCLILLPLSYAEVDISGLSADELLTLQAQVEKRLTEIKTSNNLPTYISEYRTFATNFNSVVFSSKKSSFITSEPTKEEGMFYDSAKLTIQDKTLRYISLIMDFEKESENLVHTSILYLGEIGENMQDSIEEGIIYCIALLVGSGIATNEDTGKAVLKSLGMIDEDNLVSNEEKSQIINGFVVSYNFLSASSFSVDVETQEFHKHAH